MAGGVTRAARHQPRRTAGPEWERPGLFTTGSSAIQPRSVNVAAVAAVLALFGVALVLAVGALLVVDAWLDRRRRRRGAACLAARLAPFRRLRVSEAAADWLKQEGRRTGRTP